MDKIRHQIVEGDAFYGNAQAFCHTCKDGKVLDWVEGGNFANDAVTQAQISTLLEIARAHKREQKKQGHEIAIYEYRRGPQTPSEDWTVFE